MQENNDFLTKQIITYIGNKRALIFDIQEQVELIKKKLAKSKCVSADLFSGSGIVARMLKAHSKKIICNDLENYSLVINSCYLTNKDDFDERLYDTLKTHLDSLAAKKSIQGIITHHYSPKDQDNIRREDRVFYTKQNALIIDTYRALIEREIPHEMKNFFLAPLITEASIHTNTSGVFKGFYKDKNTGIGTFGGAGKNALSRIMTPIELKKPVLSNFNSQIELYQENAIELSGRLKNLDITYLDPPYNQHPYGSNYFMLNLILENKITSTVSPVSGIVSNWNRSEFNKRTLALDSLEKIISNLDSKYIIISYNSEGFISFDKMTSMLKKYGKLSTKEITYNTFRGSRNLSGRAIHVSEYLFILEKTK